MAATVKTPEQVATMRRAGRIVAEMLDACQAAARPGITTADLDKVAREVLARRKAKSNFLNYHGYPAVICTSPNNVIVHGIPGNYRLQDGDIISIDCGAIIDGWHGDAARTIPVGEISEDARKLIRVTEESLWAGIQHVREAAHLLDIGHAVQTVAEGRASPWCGSTSATGSAGPCTRSLRYRTTASPARGSS